MSDQSQARPGDDRRVILHIGWPKTATTSIQHQLLTWPNNAGRPWFRRDGDGPRAVLRMLVRGAPVPGSDIDRILQASWHERSLPVVLSDEALVGLPRTYHATAGLDASEVAAAWAVTTWPTTVVATLREPASLLRSSYRFAIRAGYPGTYRDYLAIANTQLDRGEGPLSFHRVLSAWREVAGEGNVVVRWMEDYVTDHRGFWTELSGATSTPELARLARLPAAHLNSASHNPLWIELTVNRVLSVVGRRASPGRRRRMRRRYNRWVARWLPRSSRPLHQGCEDLEREVVARLEHDLDRVCADFGTQRPSSREGSQ